jgi:uncharacterized membrane protein
MWDWDDEDRAEESAAEDDPVDWERARTATRDRDGNVRWRRVYRAVRGRGFDHDDMILPFAGTLLVFVAAVAAVALDGGYSVVDTLTWAAFLLVLYVGILVKGVGRRLDEYHADDPDVESRLLGERYAAGDLDDEEFERRIEVLLEDGPAVAREIDADEDQNAAAAEDDPLVTLRRRFATSEIDEDEYRSRLETLRETATDDEAGSDGARERELDRE